MGASLDEQAGRARAFGAMHVPGKPLILFNVWDAGSAKAVAGAGAKALATGSASVAAAHGYADGEQLPLELALANVDRVVGATDLPVSLDLERGYGAGPDAVGATVERALATGIVGCNIEDSFEEGGPLRAPGEQAARIAAARAAADRAQIPLFINARSDLFFQKPKADHDERMIEETLQRARVYADAGADGIFVPVLSDERLIARLVEGSPLPVNIISIGDNALPPRRLAALGVARVSFGPGPYRLAMKMIEEAATAAFAD